MAGATNRTYTAEEIVDIKTYVDDWQEGTHYVRDGQCLTWIRTVTSKGYGSFNIKGLNVSAHKGAWIARYGTNPQDNLTLDHICLNTRCVNVDHMRTLTRADNNRKSNRVITDLQSRTHCPMGHPLKGNNLRPNKPTRQCESCMKARSARVKAQQHGKDFTDDGYRRLADAYCTYLLGKATTPPLAPTDPDVWEGLDFNPRVTRMDPSEVDELV
jgi:hypothetical protein